MKTIEEEEWIIWNSELGLRDFVMIGEIDRDSNTAWLDEPYHMVGPFALDELIVEGQIRFAACVVMSKERWQNERIYLLQDSMRKRARAQQEFFEELEKRNRRRSNAKNDIQKEYRKLLDLPHEGTLTLSQIKSAYRKMAKKAHPDSGGSKELFCRIKDACDSLIELI